MDLLTELQRTSEAWRNKAARVKATDWTLGTQANNSFATAVAVQALESCADDIESLIWQMKQEQRNVGNAS